MQALAKLASRVVVLIVALLIGVFSVSAQSDSAVRFVHVIPNAAPIDVYINGTLAVQNLGYGDATGYIRVPAGDHTIAATPTGIASPIWQQTVTVSAGTASTLIASSAEEGRFNAFGDNLNATAFGSTRLLLIHALAGGPAVDVKLAEAVSLNGVIQEAGTVIASGMAYGTSFGAFDLPAQNYVVDVVPSGAADALLQSISLGLNSGSSYMAVVYGTATSPQAILLSAPTTGGAGDGFVRFVHGVVGAPNVDVFVNDTLIAANLSTDTPSEHIALPAGDHAVELRVAGGEDVVADGTVTVVVGAAQTVVALAVDGGVAVSSFADDLSGISETSAVVSVINTIEGATASVALSDGTTLATDLATGSSSGSVTVTPDRASIGFELTFGSDSGSLNAPEDPFYGGVYYNLIVLDGNAFNAPSILVAPTYLAQTLASAPDAGSTIATTNPEVQTSTQPEVVQSTPAPVVATTSGDAVTALVVLDPSANLQLRQYPNAEALSLGLAPSGSTLVINGREGAPVALVEGQDPPEGADEWVDPATLLEDEDADLDPSTTWLNITYATPDGGEIVAWVLSQFLVVRDADGDLQRLADLPMIGGNIAGAARNTEITPPAVAEDRTTAIVINLSSTANLNLRRTPAVDGEVLAQLPLDTVVELVGFIDAVSEQEGVVVEFIPAEAAWAFIRYTPSQGGIISGWASTSFLRYEWNGRNVTVDELFTRNLTTIVAPDTIGGVSAGTTTSVSVPTPDPQRDAYVAEVILDPTANLQFRRSPDSQSESINLVPSGTLLIVEARTLDNEWIRSTFEGQTGWVSTRYLFITFNGREVEIEEIPVDPSLQATPEPASNG